MTEVKLSPCSGLRQLSSPRRELSPPRVANLNLNNLRHISRLMKVEIKLSAEVLFN